MRVLIATGIFPPDIGGPATYSKKMTEELMKRSHEVVIITYYDGLKSEIRNPKFETNPNVQIPKIFRVSRRWPTPLRHFLYFLQILWFGRNVDLIYLQDPVSAGLPTTSANLFLRKRLVLKIVGDYAWESLRRGDVFLDEFYPFKPKKYSLKIWLFKIIQTWVAGRADKIITPSEYLKGIVKKWGIAEKKIDVVYNAVQLPSSVIPRFNRGIQESVDPRVHRQGGASKPEDDSDGECFTIVSVGRLVPWKGYEGLIEAFAGLSKEHPNLKLKIIGDGPQMSNIQFLISNLRLQDRVQLSGALPHEKTLQEMANASLFALNTAYEGLSHVLLEALAVGTPVITTAAGGNPEVIKDGWNGVLIKYNDLEALRTAIIKMIGDKDFRETCAKNGLQSLEKFSEERMVKQTLNILEIRN